MSDENANTEEAATEAVDTPAEAVDYGKLKFDESEAAERPGSVCNISAL